MASASPSVCFATLAVGHEYRALAELLLQDIARHCPDVPVFVVSDTSELADGKGNVAVIPFVNPGFWYLYYGKIQAIRAAMEQHDVCVFVDADSRLLFPPPFADFGVLAPGAYGAYRQTFAHKFSGDQAMFLARGGKERWLRNTPQRQLRLYTALGGSVGVRAEECFFLHEACFVFVKNDELLKALDVWEFLGRAASARLLEWGEGCTLGMALRAFDLPAGEVPAVREWLFKDILLSPDERAKPTIASLLAERGSKTSSPRDKWARSRRFVSGALRYLKRAPMWLLLGERRALARLPKAHR